MKRSIILVISMLYSIFASSQELDTSILMSANSSRAYWDTRWSKITRQVIHKDSLTVIREEQIAVVGNKTKRSIVYGFKYFFRKDTLGDMIWRYIYTRDYRGTWWWAGTQHEQLTIGLPVPSQEQKELADIYNSIMKSIKVKETARYRDGGTIRYTDINGENYYLWYPTKEIYSDIGKRDKLTDIILEIVSEL